MAAIVTVNVNQQVGSTPSGLQRTGAIISVGGTSLAANAKSLLTQASDLTALLAAAVVNSTLTWSGSVVTVTTATPHGYTTGDLITVSGVTPAAYNGTYAITVTGASTFTYALVSDPGSETVPGVSTDADVSELVAQVTTFFAQGSNVSVYVLEMGNGTAVTAIAALATYITANPGVFYSFLVPRLWDAEATYVTLVGLYTAATAKLYFHTTVTLSTYTSFVNKKSVLMTIEAPGIPATEFTAAAGFWVTLNYNPSPTNQVTPLCFAYLFGVTAYPVTVTQAATFKAANLNYVTTGAEGGISNKMLVWGVTTDGNPFNYWYSVDWMQTNVDMQIAAAVINGSNNPLAPLYYDQSGVNRLQIVAQSVSAQAVANGLSVGPVSAYALTAANFTALLGSGTAPIGVLVNAVPVVSYLALNPNDYALGKYGGLAISYTPARGFTAIVFNVNVSNFIP